MEMRAISTLINKVDQEKIAEEAGFSVRTVEAVKQGNRDTDLIKKLLFQTALKEWNEMGKVFNRIQLKNTEFASIEEYKNAKSSDLWQNAREYDRYMDIYLTLVSIDWKSIDDLWTELKTEFNDMLQLQYYCIDLICRVLGVKPSYAIRYYNTHI